MKYLLLFIICCFGYTSYGQSTTASDNQKPSSWEYDITPYIWFASISGDISFINQSIPVEANFGDILSDLKMGALVHAEARRDRWIFFTDLVYLKVVKDGQIELLSLDTELDLRTLVFEGAVGYRTLNNSDDLSLDFFAGFRYFGIKSKLEVGSLTFLDQTISTVDPMLGARFAFSPNDWTIQTRLDMGGFGIGSEFSWKANLVLGYSFSELFSLHTGYQAYGIDIDEGRTNYDLTLAGFLLGGKFHF